MNLDADRQALLGAELLPGDRYLKYPDTFARELFRLADVDNNGKTCHVFHHFGQCLIC
jgi:hypothetical protein